MKKFIYLLLLFSATSFAESFPEGSFMCKDVQSSGLNYKKDSVYRDEVSFLTETKVFTFKKYKNGRHILVNKILTPFVDKNTYKCTQEFSRLMCTSSYGVVVFENNYSKYSKAQLSGYILGEGTDSLVVGYGNCVPLD